jgi:AcrR family transcriptional regulator
MGTKERRERERDTVRTMILDAARELFAANGYEGVSMRAIAEKIEYSPTLIYQYFEDKETLIRELCNADFGSLAERLNETMQIVDPLERLRQCGREYVNFGITYPNHYRLMFMTPLPVKHDEAEWEAKRGKPETDAYAFVQLLVKKAAEEGALRDSNADIEIVSQTLWAGLHGVIALEIAMRRDKEWAVLRPIHERTEAMLDALGGGIFAERR